MVTPPGSPSVLRLPEKLGYAAGDAASCVYWQTFSTFLMIFYTDTFGLAPAAVGTMLLLARVGDAAIDPVMGMIADRTATRWGKFRPWILWGTLPLAVSAVLVFITPPFSPGGKLAYAYVTYSLVMIFYTMVNVPYGALLGVISPHSGDRTQLASFRFIGAFTGSIVIQGTLLYLVQHLGGGNDRTGYPLTMAAYGVLVAALFLFTFLSTRERVPSPPSQTTIKGDLADLSRNVPWILLCAMALLSLIYCSVRNGATVYYFKYYLRDQDAVSAYLVTGTVFSVLGATLAPRITALCGGKKRAFLAITLFSVVIQAVFYFIKPDQLPLVYGCNILQSMPGAAMFPIIWSMYADTADYGAWKFGRRATGLVFAAATFAQKVGWAVGGALAGFMLSAAGFAANALQSSSSLEGIRHLMSTVPAALALVVFFVALRYPLDQEQENQMARELAARAE